MSGRLVADSAAAWSADGGDAGVLVLHGVTGNPTAVRPLAERLAREGFAVELPRLPGHGTHWRELDGVPWQAWADEADAGLRRLLARTGRVAIAGLSYGAAIGMLLAARRPLDVRALVLVNPALTIGADHPLRHLVPVAPLIGRVMPPIPGVANDIAKPGADEKAYPRVGFRAAAETIKLQRAVRAALGRVRAPTLVLTSRVDHVAPPSDSTLALDRIASETTEHVWLEHSLHVATLDHDAPIIEDRAVAFLRRHLPASTTDEHGAP